MDAAVYSALGGAVAGIVTVIVALIRTRGTDKSKTASLKQQGDEYLDKRIQSNLKEAYDRIDKLEKDRDFQKGAVSILGAGFDALVGIVERIVPPPAISQWEAEMIAKAKELRADDSSWPTVR